MAKKNVAVSLRKPPPPADLQKMVVAAAMPRVSEAVMPTTTTKSDVRELASEAKETFVAQAKTKPGFRSITIDLPEHVADKLMSFCSLHERDVHEVVAEIIAKHLAEATASKMPEKAPEIPPPPMDLLVAWVKERVRIVGSMRDRIFHLGRAAFAAL